MVFRKATLLLSLFAVLHAQTDTAAQTLHQYIDQKQRDFSQTVTELFENIDIGISTLVEKKKSQEYCLAEQRRHDKMFLEGHIPLDEFFINEKFVYETQKSFLRMRLGTTLQSKDSTDFHYKIRAQVPLSRSKKSLHIFIDDIKQDYFQESEDIVNPQQNTEIGISYFTPKKYDIESKYSLSISGLSAYATARYYKKFYFGTWTLQPTQQFRYSTKNDLSEETNIYLDKKLSDISLFRTTLYRKTESNIDGFDYRATFAYYFTPKSKKGFSIIQSFWGNSKYRCDASLDAFNGISDYSTLFSWRQNIFRKWITFEMQPAVSFHRRYDYNPNYIFRFYIDFYFGRL